MQLGRRGRRKEEIAHVRSVGLAIAISCVWVLGNPAAAGVTERACMASPRSPGVAVCRCAQSLADLMLSASDQREAARIIADPDRYLVWRERRRAAARAFLDRYDRWGEASAEFCRPR